MRLRLARFGCLITLVASFGCHADPFYFPPTSIASSPPGIFKNTRITNYYRAAPFTTLRSTRPILAHWVDKEDTQWPHYELTTENDSTRHADHPVDVQLPAGTRFRFLGVTYEATVESSSWSAALVVLDGPLPVQGVDGDRLIAKGRTDFEPPLPRVVDETIKAAEAEQDRKTQH